MSLNARQWIEASKPPKTYGEHKVSDYVMVWTNGRIERAYYWDHTEAYMPEGLIDPFEGVTHWMPYPLGPNGKKPEWDDQNES